MTAVCAPVPVARETGSPEKTTVARETGLLARLILLPIRGYRRFISPAIAPRCRYYPTCSTYAVEAITELGAIRGTIVAAWRVLRCNPFSGGGVDPLSERRLFRAHEPHCAADHGHGHDSTRSLR